jgi:hypothetical protein
MGSWNRLEIEVVTLDIPFASFSAHADAYVDAAASALAAVLAVQPAAVTVSEFQPSSVGTTVLYFDVIAAGSDSSSSAVTPALAAAVRSLFAPGLPATGAPALPALLGALREAGLPLRNAYYQDQLVPSPAADSPAPPAPAGSMAGWPFQEGGEVLALDIPFGDFTSRQKYYTAAFVTALASLLGAPAAALHVHLIQQSSVGTTRLYFSRLLPDGGPGSVSSEVISAASIQLHALFAPGPGSPAVGAAALPHVVDAMRATGLPVRGVYQQDQLPAA